MAINLGNITGESTSGLASNLDSETLVEGLSEIRRLPITELDAKIEANTAKTEKYSEYSTILNELKNSVDFLRNPAGSILNPFANVFDYTTTSISSSTLIASSYLSVTANPGATIGDTQIEIGSLAKSLEQRSGSFNTRSGDATTAASGAYFDPGTSYDAGDGELTITFEQNGVTYTSNAITADDSVNGGANTGITSGTIITFTADSGGVNETSFDITLASDITIDADSGNVTTFLDDMITGLSDISIAQSRQISNFVDGSVKSPLTALGSTNIRFISDNFNVDSGEFGNIANFNVKASSGVDGAISVQINDETFRATGLGTTLNSNITLQSTSSDKYLEINLGDAGESIDISSSSAAVDLEKSLGYAFGTRELVDITVDSGDSLNDIIFSINQQTSDTGVSASVIQVDEFDFRLSLKSNTEGLENSYEIFDDSGVLTNASISTTQSASNSLIRVDGIEVERSSNTITDVLENVNINILQTTPDYAGGSPESVDITVESDVDTIATGIVSFLDAYNAVKVFDAEQNERDDNFSFVEDSVLGGDSILRTLSNQLVNEITSVVSNAPDEDFDSIFDVGILLQDFPGTTDTVATSNILSFDENTLKAALTSNIDKVRDIFELTAVTSDTSLLLTGSSNSFTLNEFQLEIDTSADSGEQIKLLNANGTDYLDGEGANVYLELSGGTITGASGTVVSGLEFLYTGDGSDTISVSIVQGLADRIYNSVDAYTEEGGVIDTTVEGLVTQNTDFESQKTTLEVRLESFVESLRAQFFALESAISSANSIINFLDANSAERTK